MNSIASLRVLLVDPSEEYRTTLKDLIAGRGHQCSAFPAFEVGPDTWRDADDPLPDVIILTVPLVPMPAWKLIIDILLYHPATNIIVLSFSQDQTVAKTTLTMGVKYFLSKYIDSNALLFKLEQLSKIRMDNIQIPNVSLAHQLESV